MWKRIRDTVHSSLRYKLFALVLLPTVLAMLATLAFTDYWFNNFARNNLFLKAQGDLAQAQQAIQQVERERYIAALQRLADSYEFRSMFRNGDKAGLSRALHRLAKDEGFTFVHITGELGNWLFEGIQQPSGSSKPTPLTDRAMRGLAGAGLEVFTVDDLKREYPALPAAARLHMPKTAASPDRTAFEGRALMLRAVCPITDLQGNVLAVLDGGVMLNHNLEVVNTIRDRIYGAASLKEVSHGVVALLLDDVSVSSNIPYQSGVDAVGQRAAPDVHVKVLESGKTWVTRELISGQWYISGYTPLFDVQDQGVGVLQTGFLEAPFRDAYYRSAGLLLLTLLALFSVSAWIAFRGAKRILKPIAQMTAVVRATQVGLEQRIGEIDSHDELRELARQFDAMLDLLQQRNREIQRAADELEAKVEERTRELGSKNADLEATVDLLRKTRQQLVMAEKLAAVGELAAGVAHDIHNPTAVILGNLGIMTAELGPAADPVKAEIELIMQQVERIRHIVNRLLQFARPTEDTGDIEEIDVNQVVKNIFPLVRHMVEERSIAVRHNLAASHTIRISPSDLEAILINLTINASHAVSTGGIIELTTANWGQRGVVVNIRDNGAGIAPDILQRIFDPFFTTDPQRRTGLGLSISYGLVRRYGGNITVESEPGQGSVFHVWLAGQPVLKTEHAPQANSLKTGAGMAERQRAL